MQKFLSRSGIASRRQAEALIASGRVRVNDVVIRELGTRVDPRSDRVFVDNRRVVPARTRWVLLNKPAGVLCTRRDPGRRPTVYQLLSSDDGSLRYVGRLDRDTEGLLLFTNDGDLAHQLLHPSSEVDREYEIEVADKPGPDVAAALERGVQLEDGWARAKRARLIGRREDGWLMRLVLTEGRKREVRRLMNAVGHPVKKLRRVRFGPIRLGALASGEARELEASEISRLRALAEER